MSLAAPTLYIILDTGDVEDAAKTAWVTRMENCRPGLQLQQADDRHGRHLRRLRRRPGQPGPPRCPRASRAMTPRAPTARWSPVRQRRTSFRTQVQDAVAKGATLHACGTLDDGNGAYFAPAVLTGVTPDMRAYREELFGPVAVVYKVSTDDEAVQLANVVDFGLGGAVWSTDEERAIKVAEQLEVGMANVNTPAGEGAEPLPVRRHQALRLRPRARPPRRRRIRQQAPLLHPEVALGQDRLAAAGHGCIHPPTMDWSPHHYLTQNGLLSVTS